MQIAICDDCEEDVVSIRKFLDGHKVSVYYDAGSLLADVENRKKQYDIYFLDIFMEESMNGIELAERLRMIQEEVPICFVSTSNDFYKEAYELYAIQYLVKPVQEESVKKLLRKVQKRIARDRQEAVSYSWRRSSGSILYGQITYINSDDHVLCIHCVDGSIQKSIGKLGDLEIQMCGDTFVRCHQSYIVNMYKVKSLNKSSLILETDGTKIPVSRRYYAEVRKRYQEILFEEVD